jgi:hypothetical protein
MPATAPLTIDPEFQALCPPLTADEYQQLEANLCAEGCRDPLIVWRHDDAWFLLDGHNRLAICQKHGLPYEVDDIEAMSDVELESRYDAMDWIINNQLGRRNLTPEQRSDLRGKRYNLEKRCEGRPKKLGHDDPVSGPTDERLGTRYGVSAKTIKRDGEFSSALDTLDTIKPGTRSAVLTPTTNGTTKITKKQATDAGKLVESKTVEPAPFMQREGWKPYHVLEAIEYLGTLPKDEHEPINDFLNQPFIPGDEGVAILANLTQHTPEQRQHIYTLWQSDDERDKTLAKTLAAKKKPAPDPQSLLAGRLIREVDAIKLQLRAWIKTYPEEPWIARLQQTSSTLSTVQTTWRQIASDVDQHHAERTAAHGLAFGA